MKAMRDPWDSPVAGLQTGWHPQSSFFILETAVVSVTTRSANEGVGGEAVGGAGLCVCVCVCVCVCAWCVCVRLLISSGKKQVKSVKLVHKYWHKIMKPGKYRSRLLHKLHEAEFCVCVCALSVCVCACVCVSGAVQLALCSKHHSFSPTVAEEKTPYRFNNKET